MLIMSSDFLICAILHIFEDNVVVIKIVIKSRSFTNETCIQNRQNCFDFTNIEVEPQVSWKNKKLCFALLC